MKMTSKIKVELMKLNENNFAIYSLTMKTICRMQGWDPMIKTDIALDGDSLQVQEFVTSTTHVYTYVSDEKSQTIISLLLFLKHPFLYHYPHHIVARRAV